MSHQIKYLTDEDVFNGKTEPSEMAIIENPKRLIEGDIFHDVDGNAWEISEIFEPHEDIIDPKSDLDLTDPEFAAPFPQEKIFIIDGIKPTAVEKKPPSAQPAPPLKKTGRGVKRHGEK